MASIFNTSKPQYVSNAGSPGLNWKLYIGEPNEDTKTNLITVYSDEGLTSVISQTTGIKLDQYGRASSGGASALVYIDDAAYPTYSYVLENDQSVVVESEQEVQSIPGGNVFTNSVFKPDVSTTTVPGVAGVDYTVDTFPPTLTLNNLYSFRAHINNTGAFNVNGVDVLFKDATAPTVNMIVVDGVYDLLYNGSDFVIQNHEMRIATETDLEAGTSEILAVPPAQVINHALVPKSVAYITYGGGTTYNVLRKRGIILSATQGGGTGLIEITLSTPISNYIAIGSATNSAAIVFQGSSAAGPTSTIVVRLGLVDGAFTSVDSDFNIAIYGEI